MAPALLAPFHPTLQRLRPAASCAAGAWTCGWAPRSARSPDDQVMLADGDELPSDVTVWAAGVAAPDAVARWGLPQGHGGRILIGPDLRVAGQDRIFAIGRRRADRGPAAAPARPAGHPERAARRAADRAARWRAGPPQPFRYHDKGIMATIGRRCAVVELPRGCAAARHAGLARLARPAPVLPAGRAQPAVRAAQPVLALPDLGARRRRHRRRRPARCRPWRPGAGAARRRRGFRQGAS